MDWIVIDGNDQMHKCLRCGAQEPVKMPAPVKAFLLRGKAFIEEHKDCKPKP